MDIAGRVVVEDSVIWDLCSGTGALGLEALSWGASFCMFVDSNPRCTRRTSAFLAERDADGTAEIITADVTRYITRETRGGKPGLVFIDPPYAARRIYDWIESFDWENVLAPEGMIFVEYGTEPPGADGWKIRRYGDTYLKYMKKDRIR